MGKYTPKKQTRKEGWHARARTTWQTSSGIGGVSGSLDPDHRKRQMATLGKLAQMAVMAYAAGAQGAPGGMTEAQGMLGEAYTGKAASSPGMWQGMMNNLGGGGQNFGQRFGNAMLNQSTIGGGSFGSNVGGGGGGSYSGGLSMPSSAVGDIVEVGGQDDPMMSIASGDYEEPDMRPRDVQQPTVAGGDAKAIFNKLSDDEIMELFRLMQIQQGAPAGAM